MEQDEKVKQVKTGFLQAFRALARRTGAVWNQEHDQPVIEAIDALVEVMTSLASTDLTLDPSPRRRGGKSV